MSDNKLPLGFGMALSQNEAAMQKFEALSETEKENIIQKNASSYIQTGNARIGQQFNEPYRHLSLCGLPALQALFSAISLMLCGISATLAPRVFINHIAAAEKFLLRK